MAKIYDLKKTLKSDPIIAKMILPSTKSEIFFDLDGKGRIGFAYIDSKGDGDIDTFAFGLTGDGSLDLYLVDSDGNGVADTVKYYPDGADTPVQVFVDKKIEDVIKPLSDSLYTAMKLPSATAIETAIRGARDALKEKGLNFGADGTLSAFRRKLMSTPETAKLICPSAINEIFLDLDGDGKADFAFIDSNGDGTMDAFAIDFTNEGEFDFYLMDADKNFLFDTVRYFDDNSDELTYSSEKGDKTLEQAVAPYTVKFNMTLTSKWDAVTLINALNTFKFELVNALHKWHNNNAQ